MIGKVLRRALREEEIRKLGAAASPVQSDDSSS
jgi:hypothetical protein